MLESIVLFNVDYFSVKLNGSLRPKSLKFQCRNLFSNVRPNTIKLMLG